MSHLSYSQVKAVHLIALVCSITDRAATGKEATHFSICLHHIPTGCQPLRHCKMNVDYLCACRVVPSPLHIDTDDFDLRAPQFALDAGVTSDYRVNCNITGLRNDPDSMKSM
jgi:hypothetical protein